MTFQTKIRKSNATELSEIVNIIIWQKITYVDNSKQIKKILPKLIPLASTAQKIRANSLLLKKRNDRHTLYKLDLYNEMGMMLEKDYGGTYYFQFGWNDLDIDTISSIKKVEFSLNQNFAKTLTNLSFQNNYNFQKKTDANYSFFILSESGTKYYEKTLKPFYIDFPKNSVKHVFHSLESIVLPEGFYSIDNQRFFFDHKKEVFPHHYIIKVTV